MKIFIVRHGETDSNKAKKLMGVRVDDALNPEGIRQANELAKEFNLNDFDIIFTSPLKRARQTAEILADKIKAPIVENINLKERDFGSMSGKTWDEMGVELNLKQQDSDQKYNYRPYGGESVEEVRNRLVKFIDELKSNYSDKKVLIVAHGGILKLLHMMLFERKMDKHPDNGSIHEFEV